MQRHKLLLSILFGSLLFAGVAYAAPGVIYQSNSVLPTQTDTFDLGTTSKEWNGIYAKNITVTGSCTGCGGGSLSGGTAGMLPAWLTSSSLTSTSTPTAGSFYATSTTASVFPYASSTALTAGALFGNTIAISLGSNAIAQFNNGASASAIWGMNAGIISQSGLAQFVSSAAAGLAFYTGGTRNSMTAGSEVGRFTPGGTLDVGTTSPWAQIQSSSTTAPQIALIPGTNTNSWSLRALDGSNFWLGTSTVAGATSTTAALSIDTNSIITINALKDLGVRSALELADANGNLTAYGGASSCGANNFFTGFSAIGASTCGTASVTVNTAGDLTGGGSLALGGSLTLTATPPFTFKTVAGNNTTFATATAATTTPIWSQGVFFASSTLVASQFPYASTTALSASGAIFLPTTTSLPAPLLVNQLAINTTSASSSIAVGAQQYFASTTVSFTYPTSTPAGTSTGLFVQNANRGYKVDAVACLSLGGATSTVEIGNGSATTTYQAGFTYPIPTTLSSPILVDAWKRLYINIGTWGSTAITSVSCGITKENAY